MSEVWRPIPDFPLYEVSNLGRVRSIDRMVFGPYGRMQKRTECILSFSLINGYAMVGLYRGSKRLRRGVHRLVLLAFAGPRVGDVEARHLNGDRGDNRLENLAWGTPAENAADRDNHGRTARGEKNGFAKLTATQVAAIRAASGSRRAIGAQFGISGAHVSRIRSGAAWNAAIAAAPEAPGRAAIAAALRARAEDGNNG